MSFQAKKSIKRCDSWKKALSLCLNSAWNLQWKKRILIQSLSYWKHSRTSKPVLNILNGSDGEEKWFRHLIRHQLSISARIIGTSVKTLTSILMYGQERCTTIQTYRCGNGWWLYILLYAIRKEYLPSISKGYWRYTENGMVYDKAYSQML